MTERNRTGENDACREKEEAEVGGDLDLDQDMQLPGGKVKFFSLTVIAYGDRF